MLFQNNLNSKNSLFLFNEPNKDLFTPNKSPFSNITTSFSSQETKNNDDIRISEFPQVIKSTPNYLFPTIVFNSPFIKSNLSNICFSNILDIGINSEEGIKNNNFKSFIGNKRKLDIKELQVKNNYPKNEKPHTLSAFDKTFKNIKIKSSKKNKIKKYLFNKIIISENNKNNNTLKENDLEGHSNGQTSANKNLFKSIKLEGKDKKENTSNIFHISEKQKRGRKSKNEFFKKKTHDAFDYDNILRKIQVHFLTFIVAFANDLIGNFSFNNKELKFKNLSYNLKKIVKHSYVESLKNSKIGEILRFKVSSKNKKSNEDVNIQTYEKICSLYPCLKDFFEMNYLELFNQYYFKSNKVITFKGKNIALSKNTRVFSDLIEKNKKAAEKIQEVAIHNFIENYNGDRKQTVFIIKK